MSFQVIHVSKNNGDEASSGEVEEIERKIQIAIEAHRNDPQNAFPTIVTSLIVRSHTIYNQSRPFENEETASSSEDEDYNPRYERVEDESVEAVEEQIGSPSSSSFEEYHIIEEIIID